VPTNEAMIKTRQRKKKSSSSSSLLDFSPLAFCSRTNRHRRIQGEEEDDGGHDQREPGGARAAGARGAPARGGRARPARRLRYGAGHQGPGAPVLAGAAQRALAGVHLRR